jgi:hypothetical protein
MWIADTTVSDGIAIVAFATVLFLILFGIVSLAKWNLRLLSGKPNPARMETVVLVLECKEFEDDEGDEKVYGDIRNFALYLQSKLAKEKAGHYSEINQVDDELFLCFEGPDANRIWDLLNVEIEAYSPAKPQRAILEHTRNGGGTRVLEPIAWQPGRKLDFQPLPEVGIPEKWLRLSLYGQMLSILGFSGLIG